MGFGYAKGTHKAKVENHLENARWARETAIRGIHRGRCRLALDYIDSACGSAQSALVHAVASGDRALLAKAQVESKRVRSLVLGFGRRCVKRD